MQVSPCPLLERCLAVVRIGDPARRVLQRIVGLTGRCAREADGSHVLERAQLLIAHRAVILVAAQLRQGKGEQVRGPGVVALQALGAAVPVPGLLPLASRSMRILHGEGSLLTGGGYERGLGLSVVPGVRVAVPGGAVPVKN